MNTPEVIIMSVFGFVPQVMEATGQGAFRYLEKPLERDKVLVNVKQALENAERSRKWNSQGSCLSI